MTDAEALALYSERIDPVDRFDSLVQAEIAEEVRQALTLPPWRALEYLRKRDWGDPYAALCALRGLDPETTCPECGQSTLSSTEDEP